MAHRLYRLSSIVQAQEKDFGILMQEACEYLVSANDKTTRRLDTQLSEDVIEPVYDEHCVKVGGL